MSLDTAVFKLLKNVNINVNADITVALRKDEGWKMFEVYNQAARHGGKLIIRDYSHRGVLSQSKYIRRRNMTGVVFKSLIVVLNLIWSFKEILQTDFSYLCISMAVWKVI